MPRIEVETAVVEAAASQVRGAGTTVRGVVGDLESSNLSSSGFQTPDAVGRFSSVWSTALTAYADACGSVAGRLSNAGIVYEVTESKLTQTF